MAGVKWIKLATNVFNNRKIRLIESMPDGDSIIVIWFKLLMLAGDVNDDGWVYFTKDLPYTDQMLATLFDRPITTVQLSLKTFEEFRMIEIVDDIIHISNWEKYQNVAGLDRIREQTRQRVSKHRERQKLEQKKEDVTLCNVTGNVTVTQCNATDIDKDIDKDIEIDIKEDISKDISFVGEPDYAWQIREIIEYLNFKTGKHYKPNTKGNRDLIIPRLKDKYTVDDFKQIVDNKCVDWLGNKDMERYLRPETLFCLKHFESYLNEKTKHNDGLEAWLND